MIAELNGKISSILRNNTDSSVDGWIYNKLFKIYQSIDDKVLDNN